VKKALIVDDIPEYVDTLEAYLEDRFDVLTAQSHNFLRVHFTTKEVPAVSLGLIESGLVPEELFSIQCM
jgi:hypothetical protein